jgi:hypothetical protein
MLYRVPPGTGPAAVATARKAGKMIRATLVALALLSAAAATVVGQPTPFDPAEEEEALQVVAVLVVHARECSNNREYKQKAETMRQSFTQKFPQLERLVAQANAYRVMVGDPKFCQDVAVMLDELAQKPR